MCLDYTYKYKKDKNNVYRDETLLEWADPNTFELLDNWYVRDKNNCYKYTEKVDMSECEK